MEVLHGINAYPGVAIATAARLHDEFGIPLLAPERLRRLGERLRSYGRESPEPEQIILVADSVPPGYWLTALPGIKIIGFATETDLPISPHPNQPGVIGVGEALLQTVQEEDIIIVDGDRGQVYVAPDAATVARYQAPLIRGRRYFLEGSHMPARTASDNRVIPVFCAARTLVQAENAMTAGADGLVIPEDNELVGGRHLAQTAGEQAQVLGDLAEIIGGQPLTLDIPTEHLALSALARGAARLPLHLVLRDFSERSELQERILAMEAALQEENSLFGRLLIEAGIAASGDDLPETLEGYTGSFVTGTLLDASWERLLHASGQARAAGKPITVALNGDWWPQVLGDALGMGFGQIVVPAQAVADVKDAIREL